jgi:hypothetical protein
MFYMFTSICCWNISLCISHTKLNNTLLMKFWDSIIQISTWSREIDLKDLKRNLALKYIENCDTIPFRSYYVWSLLACSKSKWLTLFNTTPSCMNQTIRPSDYSRDICCLQYLFLLILFSPCLCEILTMVRWYIQLCVARSQPNCRTTKQDKKSGTNSKIKWKKYITLYISESTLSVTNIFNLVLPMSMRNTDIDILSKSYKL